MPDPSEPSDTILIVLMAGAVIASVSSLSFFIAQWATRWAGGGPAVAPAGLSSRPRCPAGPAEDDELWREWLRRDDERAAGRERDADGEDDDARPGPRARRRFDRPLATVAEGAYAGCLVRLLMPSESDRGAWFVEVVGGDMRGSVTVVRGGWLVEGRADQRNRTVNQII